MGNASTVTASGKTVMITIPMGPTDPLDTVRFIEKPEWFAEGTAKATVLSKTSEEYIKAAALFHNTLNFLITNIERIENSNLFRAFALTCDCKCREAGLDYRYCGDNKYLGRGSYFAATSKYSHDYAYSIPNLRNKQMLLCRVLTGNPKHYGEVTDETRKLTLPPLIEGSKTKRHDSVSVDQRSSIIYAVYELNVMYPDYLITYDIDKREK